MFLSPHLNTLPIHASLSRNKRASFPLPCILSSGVLLALSLPFALVPYYLLPALPDPLPTATPTTSTGVFGRLPADDGWVNLARVLQCIIGLGTANMWILRCRDSVLGAVGVERGQTMRIGRWIGLGLWVFVVGLACIGGWVAEKVELLGVIATLSVGWLLPCESPRGHPYQSQAYVSGLLHHHLPRAIAALNCLPIAQSSPGCGSLIEWPPLTFA